MARPRTFNESEALDAAIECFWHHGLEATSVRGLAAEMGLNCPSLYNAFGDKRALFGQALERYAVRFLRERLRSLAAQSSAKTAIQMFFDDLITRTLADPDKRGCFVINAALEVAPHDSHLRTIICGYLAEIEDFFRAQLERAKASCEIPSDLMLDDMARLFLGLALGIRVIARTKPQRSLLEGMARPALALLEHPDRLNRKGMT